MHSYETGEVVKTLIDLAQINNEKIKSFNDFSFNADESKVLLLTDKEAIYRRSFTANYFIYDIAKQTLTPLSGNGKRNNLQPFPLMEVKWHL